MKLKKCKNPECNKKNNLESCYTLKENCPACEEKTSEAHYKFINVKGKLESMKEKKNKDI